MKKNNKQTKKVPTKIPARKVTTVEKKEKKVEAPTNHPKIQPLQDRIVLKPLSPEESGTVTSSGIIIPETVDKEKPERGRVVAVGPGKMDNGKVVAVRIKVGDIVVFSKYGFDEIKIDGEEFYILREENILAIIKQ